ncbi:MAG: omptin family outer membrane protease [Treponema sp.]|nr:omptin family outer membrane protease [Treponema sp.]
MRSIAIIGVFVILIPGFLCAEGEKKPPRVFSVNTELGVIYGTSYEILYDGSFSDRYLSELQWNIKPLFFAGLSVEFAPRDILEQLSFFAGLEIKSGLPMETGVVEDRDWFPRVPAAPGALTHFSSHENRTKAAFLADLAAGVSFPLGRITALKLSAVFSYMFFKYEAWNGYYQYGSNGDKDTGDDCVPWEPGFARFPLPGLVMDYTQHWFILYPAVTLVVRERRVSFSISVAVSPAVLCVAFDNHFLRHFLTHEIMYGGIFFEPEARLGFSITDSLVLGISASYRYIGGTRGNSFYTDTASGADTPWMKDVSGAGYRAFQGKVVFKIGF